MHTREKLGRKENPPRHADGFSGDRRWTADVPRPLPRMATTTRAEEQLAWRRGWSDNGLSRRVDRPWLFGGILRAPRRVRPCDEGARAARTRRRARPFADFGPARSSLY